MEVAAMMPPRKTGTTVSGVVEKGVRVRRRWREM